MPALLDGLKITILLALGSSLIGLILGLLLALGRISKWGVLNQICRFYIWVFRGTPLLLQLFFIYYALPLLFKIEISQWPAAILSLSLNAGAYFAEIIRAGLESIDKHQNEAAKVLGLNYFQTMQRIIIPQSIKRLIPPVGNELIALTKDTSLVSTIGLIDLQYAANQISTNAVLPLIFIPAAIMYLIMTALITFIFEKLEKKYSYYE